MLLLCLGLGCAKPRHSEQTGASAFAALPDLPEPAGVVGDLRVAHPDATFRAARELGRPYSALLPAAFAMLAARVLGLPPLSADSFDPDLPLFGLLVDDPSGKLGWVLALHVTSGPELVAKLCAGDRAPFRTLPSTVAGLKPIEASAQPAVPTASPEFSLAVFDNYLLVANSAEVLRLSGPFAARMLPRRAASSAPIAFRFGTHAIRSNVVPALRGLWAGYRGRLRQLDDLSRSAHAGRTPDFADPASAILGADALVESLLSLLDGAAGLELGVDPLPERLDAFLVLEPEPGSDVQSRLATLAAGTAKPLLSLPAGTELALGLRRSAEDRELAGKTAGDDWARLLGSRLTAGDAKELRSVLVDWELGRGTQINWGFLGGDEAGAFLVTDVADGARLKRAGNGLLGLLKLPGLRAPIIEFLGQPTVSEGDPVKIALPNTTRKKLSFRPAPGRQASVPQLTFSWRVDDSAGFAAVGKNADAVLGALVKSAHAEQETLAGKPGVADSVQRIGDQAALFAYVDARRLARADGTRAGGSAPMFLAIGKRAGAASVRLEISKAAIDWALQSALGQ